MRILHLTHTDIESDSRILKEIAALLAAGHKVTGLGVAPDEESSKTRLSSEVHIKTIKLHSRKLTLLPRTLRHFFTLLELLGKMLPRALRERSDVIHCHDVLVLPLGCLVKCLTGAKLVYDAHELESNRNGLTRLQGLLTLWVEKILWRFIDVLIVVSPSIECWYIENIGPKRTAIILNSPLIEECKKSEKNYLRRKFSIPASSKIFIYVGIFAQGRGLDLLTQVFTDAKISSHIIFMGYGELSPKLKHLSYQYSNIHVHDAVPHSEVVPIIKSADYGLCLVQNVSLSDYYCLPNKLFEYCFAGIPVLASDFPDIRVLVNQYGIGTCCGLELDEILNAIMRLEDEETTYDFADLNPLGWEMQEKKLVALYQQFF